VLLASASIFCSITPLFHSVPERISFMKASMRTHLARREMALVLKQLLLVCPAEFGDKPDKYGWYPLHILANNRDDNAVRPGMIRMLCAAKADLEAKKGKGQTPLMSAINSAHEAAANELVSQGADPYAENDEGTTCRDMAWHNKKMRSWVSELGVGDGAGVSGSGRLYSVVYVRAVGFCAGLAL
jgi:hypothetical protein